MQDIDAKKGCPLGIAKCHTVTQKNMVHRIRISSGISKGTISFNTKTAITINNSHISSIQGKTGGIGQGGGGGPMAWISVINIMIEVYRKVCSGASAIDICALYSLTYWIVSYVDDNTLVQTFNEEHDTKKMIAQMTGNLKSWQRLLQLTGGDIDLEKSQWCLLSWKYDNVWGIPTLNSNEQSKGELSMTSPINKKGAVEYLQRLEPNQADRVLGVRLPMDGTMKMEYDYRIRQMREFAQRMRNAPISHYDAYIVYECRYRAMIRYPLAVTQFSTDQCNNLQRPVIDAMLPKMGLNRKMPRVVVYGPMSLGGLEIMDLRLEQVTSQWETTRGHMCREDRVGKGLKLTLHDHQCIIGSESVFLNVDPTRYNYGIYNTRWKYIWTSLWENKLVTDFYDVWTPLKTNHNDVNIMDRATLDKTLLTSKWPMLDHINSCRLYLNAFYISDLSLDGVTVEKGFLDGSRRREHTTLNFPKIHKPTEAQWRIWKSFIHRNFLSPGVTINPPLSNEKYNKTIIKKKKTEVEKIEDLYDKEGTVQQILSQFPSVLHPMIGEVTIPEDGGLRLSESIVEGTCIGASDGSLLRNFYEVRGGFGYVLCQQDTDIGNISGVGISTMSDTMSSQTSEHQGLIGLLCILHAVCIKYLLNEGECWGEVIVLIDNKNVVERANKAQDPFNVSDYQIPDQDLWAITSALIKSLPIRLQCRWIRGHEDTNERGEKIHGPFLRSTQLNMWSDKLASTGLKRSEWEKIEAKPFSFTKVVLKTTEGLAIRDLRKYMLRTKNGEEILNYYREKKGWHSRVFSVIDWEALESLLRKASPIKKNRLIQVLHDWQNVGRQKGKFRDSRLGKMVEPPLQATMEEETIHLCPMGCGLQEDHLHHVRCSVPSMINKRKKLCKNAISRLTRLRTNEGICSYTNYIIKKLSNNEEISLESETFYSEDDRNLLPAIIGQQDIGWENFLKGFVHEGWARAQNTHYRRLGLSPKIYSIQRWKRMFLTIITDYGNECWKMRNEAIHGEATKEGRLVRKKRLVEQVKALYRKKSELNGSPYRRIFAMRVSQRIKMGIQSLTLWVGKAEEVLKLHREEADRNTIRRWLGCR